jgi:preprotein translocase subunit SecD
MARLRLRRRRFWSLIAPRPSESFEIELSLTETGVQRLSQASAGAIGQWLALSIDGKTIAQAVIREPLTGRTLSLAGSFTHAEAKALAARIASALD